MDLSRLRVGELLAVVAAVALLVSLFFDWDAGTLFGPEGFYGESGWASLSVVTLAFVLAALGAAGALVLFTVTKRPAAIPIGAAVITTFVGFLATIALAINVLLLDDSLGSAYAGLVAMLLLFAGGWITMRDERTSAPYSAAPNLPRRPAPPAEA